MRKNDYPQLDQNITYLDSACMSLKPKAVIEKVNEYYNEFSACSGRSAHKLSAKASEELEISRRRIAEFIEGSEDNLVFTSGTTESINTVARGFNFGNVFISEKEHNSNRVVWRETENNVCEIPVRKGLNLEYLRENIEEDDLLSILHISNLDGEEFDIESAVKIAKDKGAYTLIDAAQSIPHRPFSVKNLGADFIAFSGHKMLGPTGTGALYVSDRVKEDLSPLKYGGGAVKQIKSEKIKYRDFPQSFEPGLKNLAGYIGFGKAAEYLGNIGMANIHEHEKKLTNRIVTELNDLDKVEVFNRGPGIVSLEFSNNSAGEVAEIFNMRDIMVRSGMHCVHPWFNKKDRNPTVRVSLHLYNNQKDVDKFLRETEKIARL